VAAVTTTLDLTDRPGLSGYVGSSATFQKTVGDETVNVRVSAWTKSVDGTISAATLGVWDKGLGVYAGNSVDGHTNGHTIDNRSSYDFLVFQFDQDVQVNTAFLTAFNVGGEKTDIDMRVGISSTDVAWNSIFGVPNVAALLGTGYNVDHNGTVNSGTTYSADINPGDPGLTGNLLFVGASFDDVAQTTTTGTGKHKRTTTKYYYDSFKLGGLELTTLDSPPPAVPEPATWAMMIIGFGAAGSAVRASRRRNMLSVA
jgi:hypothetical protein